MRSRIEALPDEAPPAVAVCRDLYFCQLCTNIVNTGQRFRDQHKEATMGRASSGMMGGASSGVGGGGPSTAGGNGNSGLASAPSGSDTDWTDGGDEEEGGLARSERRPSTYKVSRQSISDHI